MSSKRKATESPAAGEDGAAGPSSKKQAAATGAAAAGALVNPKRVRVLKPGSIGKGPVVYWMSRDQRMADNWALLHAIEKAQGEAGSGQVAVAFNLVPAFLGAGARQFGFMLRGLRQLAPRLEAQGIRFYLLKGDPAQTLPQLVQGLGAGLLVTDYSPLRLGRTWRDQVCAALGPGVPVHEVDAHNVVPVWVASEKREVGARTLRPKIHKALPEFLREFPPVPQLAAWTPAVAPEAVDWDGLLAEVLRRGADVPEVEWCAPGEAAALEALTGPRGFLTPARLSLYDTKRNDPATPSALSNLSPYLHFGQLAPQRAALEAAKHRAKYKAAVESYLEELVVRRELADNFCHYCSTYDSIEAAAEWARESLDKHRTDKREFLYTRDQLESGATHDELWNAAQLEMVHVGKMHGFMRMYWAKKILEWTQGPEQAIEWAIYLNDRYELDGRDPGGYTGVLWSMAGVHDMGWAERAVFGKIRYMNYNGCKRKFDIKAYVAYVSKAVAEAKAKGRAAKLPSASGAAAAAAAAAAPSSAGGGAAAGAAAAKAKAKAEPKEAKAAAGAAAAKAKSPKGEKAAAAGTKRKAAKPAKAASSSASSGSDDD
ncbi:hypothetical protein HYH02_001594 [Chlamydomonas schloesseri]|uniref:Deoxyribodipyrimidine photo-lyase n=1 Tax=Chlamydomonas schloesseri TaxID=2026947 RepID=A0A835WTC8_9CHLO|nr:hypothetical protein HYH02_001594 [Chlamydomonas schloesseri]|eukprot:KAG2453370.1 hypothetical protein HYH02_001594 [Chlamydomonas schloesseri]